MLYIYVNIIFLFTALYSYEFELGNFYYFEDSKIGGNQRNLYRGQLNVDDSWLSAEMLYDGNSTRKKEVILFEFGGEPSKPSDGYKFRDYSNKANRGKVYDAHLVGWSNFEDNLIFSYNDNSPCIDSGNPNYTDPDGTISDIGVYPLLENVAIFIASSSSLYGSCSSNSTSIVSISVNSSNPFSI